MLTTALGVVLATGLAAPKPLSPDWCRTPQHATSPGAAAGGGCPIEGDCDIPAVRDAHAPDGAMPFRTLRVHVVVFREDDGSNPAATGQQVIDQMNRLNDDYAPSRFRFVYTWEYVDDTFFRYGGDDTLMKATYAVDPEITVNVFVTDQGGGYAVPPWFTTALTAQAGIVIGDAYFEGDTSVLSHEMGHVIGLWHTHHGVTEVDPCTACYEQADGLNGDETGDFCGDTPPTPVDWDCDYPAESDICTGLRWAPTLPESFMSYGLPCWSLFTVQQQSRMNCWFEAVLTPLLVTCPGDGNGDGEIGIEDFLGLLAAWNTADPDYDIVVNGNVGIEDFLALLAAWGAC